MYYLNDKHPKYEYALYTRVGTACPYITKLCCDDLEDIYRRIKEIEKKHNRYGQMFYIDNDFYENQCNLSIGGTYYKFLCRPVADWEEFNKEVA